MAYIWFRDHDDIWSAMPLNGRAVDVSGALPHELADGFHTAHEGGAFLIPLKAGDLREWILLVARICDALVNGVAPVAGLRVLRDRDEIRVGVSGPLFFSAETLAHVEEFPASERPICCGRCRQPMRKGELAVRCPSSKCGIWYHQTDALPCWAYARTCAFCPSNTALDSGLSWTPEA